MAEKGGKARAMAGGTDLLVQLRGRRFSIDRLVDVKGVPELNELSYSDTDGLTLGAAVPCYRIYEDADVQRLYSGLVDCSFLIGGIQIQGRATVGGNLCNASPSGDTIPMLIALDGTCIVEGPSGRRELPVAEFCQGPGKNVLADGEILVALRFPPPAPRSGAHYLRFIPRNEMDIAVAGVGASVALSDDKERIESARIGLAAVGPTPIYAEAASKLLAGKPAVEESFQEAAAAAQAVATPISDMRGSAKQRTHLVGVLAKRALRKATARAKEA